MATFSFSTITSTAKWCLLLMLSVPVIAGTLGAVFPALGYFPAIGELQFGLHVFAQLLETPTLGKMVLLSLSTGLLSTFLAVAGAFVLLASFYRSRWLQSIQKLLSPFLVFPHAAAAIVLLFVVSPSGIVARAIASLFTGDSVPSTSWWFPYDSSGVSIIVALALKELPFVLLMALSVLSQPQTARITTGYYRIGSALGYSRIAIFTKLILPQLYPQIRLPVLAVLVFATSTVEIPLLLGPNSPNTLAVAILHWFNHIDLSMRMLGSAGALLQVVVSSVAVGMYIVVERVIATCAKYQRQSGRRHSADVTINIAAYGITALYGLLFITVIYSVVLWSVAQHWTFPNVVPDGVTLLHWKTAVASLGVPLANTLQLGVAVGIVSIALVLLALESLSTARSKPLLVNNILPFTLFLPLLIPGVAFLYGLVWLQQMVSGDTIWLNTFVAHLVYVLPYVYISLAIAYAKFDVRYVKVALSLGKTPAEVFFRVKLPLMFSPIAVAFALALAISFSQYLPTILPSGGALPTLTTEAVASVSGSSERLSAVYVFLLAGLPLSVFALAWYLPKILFIPRQQRTLSRNKEDRHGA
ncbi:ABC transporter permease [Alteromonas sp. A079]|uniref:ABC transporter permease n=1 Tax=Alteromonas sp. A079 TaxID=3410268 RepID=UPI003BA205AC